MNENLREQRTVINSSNEFWINHNSIEHKR